MRLLLLSDTIVRICTSDYKRAAACLLFRRLKPYSCIQHTFARELVDLFQGAFQLPFGIHKGIPRSVPRDRNTKILGVEDAMMICVVGQGLLEDLEGESRCALMNDQCRLAYLAKSQEHCAKRDIVSQKTFALPH